MLAKVTAKNVGDVFWRHTVYQTCFCGRSLAPVPTGGPYSAPGPPSWIWGRIVAEKMKRRGRRGEKKKKKEKGEKMMGRK